MTTTTNDLQALQTLVEQLDVVFDEAVTEGDDDELFASGYLRGHFDLVVAQLELSGTAKPEHLLPALQESIQASKHELQPADQAHIQNLYQRLVNRAG